MAKTEISFVTDPALVRDCFVQGEKGTVTSHRFSPLASYLAKIEMYDLSKKRRAAPELFLGQVEQVYDGITEPLQDGQMSIREVTDRLKIGDRDLPRTLWQFRSLTAQKDLFLEMHASLWLGDHKRRDFWNFSSSLEELNHVNKSFWEEN